MYTHRTKDNNYSNKIISIMCVEQTQSGLLIHDNIYKNRNKEQFKQTTTE